jgi:hypothetical protein
LLFDQRLEAHSNRSCKIHQNFFRQQLCQHRGFKLSYLFARFSHWSKFQHYSTNKVIGRQC